MNSFNTVAFIIFSLLIAVSQSMMGFEDFGLIASCLNKRNVYAEKLGNLKYIKKHFSDIVICFIKVPSQRPLVAYYQISLNETNNEGKIQICGKNFSNREDELLTKVFQDTTTDFCHLTLNYALPIICKYREKCEKKNFDMLFALYYIMQQMNRKEQDPFECKSDKDNELLKNIINPELYTTVFDPTNKPILNKPVPCNEERRLH